MGGLSHFWPGGAVTKFSMHHKLQVVLYCGYFYFPFSQILFLQADAC